MNMPYLPNRKVYTFSTLLGVLVLSLFMLVGSQDVHAQGAGPEIPTDAPGEIPISKPTFNWEYQFDFSSSSEETAQEAFDAVYPELVNAGTQSNFSSLGESRYRLTVSGSKDMNQIRQVLYDILLPHFNLFQEPWLTSILVPGGSNKPIILKLESQPGTGYNWRLNNPDTSGFELVGKPDFKDRFEAPGAPALQTLVLRPVSSGQSSLELIYRRSFEANRTATRHLTIQLTTAVPMIDLSDPHPPQKASQASSEEYLNTRAKPQSFGTSMAGLPASYDWREYGKVSDIRDQGGCGSCWAFGTTAVMESALRIHDSTAADLSEQFLVSCNVGAKNTMCGGKYSCAGGCEDAQDYHVYETGEGQSSIGAVLESDFPYTASDEVCPADLNHPYKALDWYFVGGDYATVDQIKYAIYNYGPVTTRVCASGGFGSYTGGVYTEDNICSNHLVALVGWDDETQTWILRNSWGTWWGEEGYMHIRWGVSNVGLYASFATYQDIFSKTSPANNSFAQPTSLDLSWEASTGATSYEYCYDTTDNGACDGSWIDNGTDLSAGISDLSSGTRYFWHVRANTPNGPLYSNANENAWWSFRTAGCAAGLCVQVIDSSGNPVQWADVAAFTNLSNYPDIWTSTDSSGYASLDVSPGSYTLVAASTGSNFVVVKEVTAPGAVIVDPTGTVAVTVNAKKIGGAVLQNAGISANASPYGPGLMGSTDSNGTFNGRVTPGRIYSFSAWSWADLYSLGMPGVDISGPATVDLYADVMPTGTLTVNLDNFSSAYFAPWSELSRTVTYGFYITSGDTFTFSALNYDISLRLKKYDASLEWEYDFYKNLSINEGGTQTLTAGGDFSLSTQVDGSSFNPGDMVTIYNYFTDAYGNPLSGIYQNTTAVKTNPNQILVNRSRSNRVPPPAPTGLNPQAYNSIYPHLEVTDPNATVIFDDQSWNNWYDNSFTLPDPGVAGIHVVNLSLDTGPHNGLISAMDTFAIGPYWTISGHVRTSAGTGLNGVTMSGLPGNPVTDMDGYYSGQVAAGWTGTVTPSRSGYSFSPASLDYTSVAADMPDQDFTATALFPATPANFRVSASAATSLTLAWDDVSDEDGYNIYKWMYQEGGWEFYFYASVGADITAYTDPFLHCGYDYFYQVSAYNSFGESPRTDWITGTAAACTALPDLSIVDFSYDFGLYTNDDISFSMGIQNLASEAAGAFYIDLYIDDQPVGCLDYGNYQTRVDGLAGNNYFWWGPVIPAGSLSAGTHQVAVFADSGCEVQETDKSNNILSQITFTVTAPPVEPPAHDDFDSARIVSGLPYTDELDVVGATRGSDDPVACSAALGRRSVWYQYTPSVNKKVFLDTFGSNYDTVMSVWTGVRGSLAPVACNDDYNGVQSAIQVQINAGTTYYIQIAQFSWGVFPPLYAPAAGLHTGKQPDMDPTSSTGKGGASPADASPQANFSLIFHVNDLPTLSVSDGTFPPGSSGNITVSLDNQNTGEVAGAEWWLVYDSTFGITMTNPIVTSRTTDFSMSFSLDTTDPAAVKAHVLLYSLSGATIAPGSGPILELPFAVDSYAPAGAAVPLYFSNAILSNISGDAIPVDYSDTGTLTIKICVSGDVNCDDAVNIFDLQNQINMILNLTKPDENLRPLSWWTRADLNGDFQWNILDLQRLINIMLGRVVSTGSPGQALSPGNNQANLDTIEASPGTTGSLGLLLTNEELVASGELWLSYDSRNGLDITGVATTSRTSGFDKVFDKNASDPAHVTVHIFFYNMQGTTIAAGSGSILGLNFNLAANASGTTALHFENMLLSDSNGDSLTVNQLNDGSVTIGAHTQSLPLVTGWNLVSFRLHPADTSIAAVLSSISGQYSLVYAWDAATSSWRIYDPNLGALNDLTALDERMGFWIKMKTAQTLVVSGSVPGSTSIALKSGWNLVGYPSPANGPLPAVLHEHGVGTDFSLIYAYHANEGGAAWKLFDRAGNPLLNDLTELAPGWGYWVKASAAHTWTVP